ncbi:glycoside hydrolase family 88 protein [Ningiella sp. W23]|uniref:glycoside hydrolase family 88 protein n=1 Tax=Ningiella sp. W23 TaxID=3023715 RepID=UPI00375669C2
MSFSALLKSSGLTIGTLFLLSCDNSDTVNAQIQTSTTASSTETTLPSSIYTMQRMEHVANWQTPRIEQLDYLSFKRFESLEQKRWVQGAFYAGLTQLAERSRNTFYTQWISHKGETWNWQLGPYTYYADDQLIGQTYLWYYKNHRQEPSIIEPTKQAFDEILTNPPAADLLFTEDKDNNDIYTCQVRWCWADALFMAPATWFGLSDVTGDPKYADYANEEFKATVNFLFDEENDLLFRDSRFFDMKGDFGESLFWARGSGWVFAGLARTMEYIDDDHPDRDFYVNLFKRMSYRLKALQKEDGSWAMSLLAGEKMPQPETSGTGFFTYGLAWGVNQGILDLAEFEETIAKGWNALDSAIHPDGKLGWVQGIGAAPGGVSFDDSQIYGVGAFLLAGSAIYDLQLDREMSGEINTVDSEVKAYARFVPERQDDLAWENDKVAFRVYGPAAPLAGHSSGVDAWFKKVDYSIIDKWYLGNASGYSYHEDRGEGYDVYHTGTSRGVGGSSIWVDGEPYSAHSFKSYNILQSGKDTVEFVIRYEWETPLGLVKENKKVTLELGSQLYNVDSKFTLDGKPTRLPVAIGLATHDERAGVNFNQEAGHISTWEIIDTLGVGTGVLVAADKVDEIKHVVSEEQDVSHIWLITHTSDNGELSYKAGFAWEGAGVISTQEEWLHYLSKTSAR